MKKEIIRLTEQDLHNLIKESVKVIIKENFNHWQSPKLIDLIKQHGMPKYNSMSSNYFLTQLRDENIEGISKNRWQDLKRGIYSMELGDGTSLLYNTRNNKVAQEYCGALASRFTVKVADTIRPHNEFAAARDYNHVSDDFYSREHYKPSTRRGEDANDLRHNPYFVNDKNKEYNHESGWNRKEADRVMNNLRAGKDRYGNPNKRI